MKENQILDSLKKSIDQTPIGLLENIKNEPRTKMLRHDEITKQKTKAKSYKKFMAYGSMAAAFLMVFFGWNYQTRIPDSHIYIDVNPSVEIVSNRLDKVIDIRANNRDGKLLTEDFNYKAMTIDQAAEEILDRMMTGDYLNKDNKYLLVSVYNKNEEKSAVQQLDLDKKIHKHLQNKKLDPVILSQKIDNSSTIKSYAKQYGISVSKMTFIRNLIILNPDFETEDLVDLTIEELVSLSQGIGLDLDKILDSTDFEKIDESKDKNKEDPVKAPEAEKESDLAPIKRKALIKEDDNDEDNDEEDEDNYQDNIEEDYNDTKDKKDDEDDDKDDYKDKTSQKKNIISPDKARSIALSIANGTITDFDFNEDDMEYEVEIEFGELEYEILIDAISGAVLQVEIED